MFASDDGIAANDRERSDTIRFLRKFLNLTPERGR
jgi:hypothetical protein